MKWFRPQLPQTEDSGLLEERNSVTKPEFRLKRSFNGKAFPIPLKNPDVTRNPMHPQRFGTLIVEAVLLAVHINEKRTTEGRRKVSLFCVPVWWTRKLLNHLEMLTTSYQPFSRRRKSHSFPAVKNAQERTVWVKRSPLQSDMQGTNRGKRLT